VFARADTQVCPYITAIPKEPVDGFQELSPFDYNPGMTNPFVKPRYDSGGFASLPGRVLDLLSARRYDAVILLLLDGFGWRFVEKFQGEPFLARAARSGRIEKLTSQFPSTTAAHITTLHTGMPVGEHGIFEWNYYEPDLDAVIAPLLFSFAGTTQRDTLKPAGVKPRRLFPLSTLYQPLKKQGVTASIFQHREYTPSTYSDAVYRGASASGYKTFPQALVNLGEALAKSTPPAYFFLYYDRIDGVSHEHGPDSAQTTAEIRMSLLALEHIFMQALAGTKKKVMFLLTADHGQSEVDPATTVFINRDPRFAGVERFLRADRAGHLLVPGGSCRDFFLYVRDGLVDEARAFLSARLEGQAEVRKVAELAEAGYFGPVVSPKFRARAGDLVILPYRGASVWWYEKNKFDQKYYGHHGGLTAQEMEIPLVLWEM
jgi:predicted AlkP superfamily pyrophosphatase or phosphodiesterase